MITTIVKYLVPFSALLILFSCTAMKNFDKPELVDKSEGYFLKVSDGSQLFVYDYRPIEPYQSTIFVIAGITGINHKNEQDLLDILSNSENRVVVIHPRGTGYSDGTRGDLADFKDFIHDYTEIISNDADYRSKRHPVYLFGHSMSTAILLAAADRLQNIAGAILVNPPYRQKEAPGMSPGFGQYVKYAGYFIFAKHTPVVNMAGDPSQIENLEDRRESEKRQNDPLLVKYFSMYLMSESKKVMDSMLDFSQVANYPLLLIYGEKDNLVDKQGCDLIYENWKHPDKKYVLVKNGTHGKTTVLLCRETIIKWIKDEI